jgi:pyruvate kinase
MRTKVIVTYGPAIMRANVLKKVLLEGTDVIRINSKYIDVKQFDSIKNKIEKIRRVKIMVDIKDRAELEGWALKKFDYLAISFAESIAEVEEIRGMFSKRVKIISKIETDKGVKNVNGLIRVSDGVMIARGDLGRDISYEKVPMVQKMITKKCNRKGKMSITATEILPSMVSYVRPSRAEVSDVANAILEGSEALMLAEETAVGKHPYLAVRAMVRIIKETEKHIRDFK